MLPSGLCHQGAPHRRDNAEQRSSAEPVRDGITAGHANCPAHSFQTSGGCRRTCLDRSCGWLALFVVGRFTSFSGCPGILASRATSACHWHRTYKAEHVRQCTGPGAPQGTRKTLSAGPLTDREDLSEGTAICTPGPKVSWRVCF